MEIKRDVILAPMTSYNIGGPARFYAEPSSRQEVVEALRFARNEGLGFYVLSAGTDVLVPDEGVDGVVISCRRLKGVQVEGPDLIASPGEGLSRVCIFSAEMGLSGLEELYGIPGAIGGAVAKNAGAYGREMADLVSWAEVVVPDGEVVRLEAPDLGMGYRTSRLPGLGILVRAGIRLGRGDPGQSRSRMYYYNEKRKRHQPIGQRSAGCVFKNPPGDHAARLIEEAGLKGARVGGAVVSERHANFIVNTGSATAGDVLELIGMIKTRVYETFGVMLEEEIEIFGGAA